MLCCVGKRPQTYWGTQAEKEKHGDEKSQDWLESNREQHKREEAKKNMMNTRSSAYSLTNTFCWFAWRTDTPLSESYLSRMGRLKWGIECCNKRHDDVSEARTQSAADGSYFIGHVMRSHCRNSRVRYKDFTRTWKIPWVYTNKWA